MSEQTANLCTTDAAESLRQRLAKYEDAEGNPIAQPAVVVLPDPKKEIVAWGHDMGGNYDEGHADGWNDALDEVARLNSSPVSAGDDAQYPPCDYCAEPLSYHPWHGSGLINGVESRHIHACDKCRHLLPTVSAGEYGDAYQGAREDLAIWKRRALEAESKIREQDQIIENLGNALNEESGPTFMGEPVVSAVGVDERAAFEASGLKSAGSVWHEGCYQYKTIDDNGDEYFTAGLGLDNIKWEAWQARAALSAPSHGEHGVGWLGHDGWRQAVDNVSAYAHLYNSGFGIIHEIRAEYARLLAATPSPASQKEQGE